MTYTYDYASNRTSRDNVLVTGTHNVWDQDYTYDGLHRLKETDQGTASDTTHLITTKNSSKTKRSTNSATGRTSPKPTAPTTTLNQNRTHNVANELTAIDSWQNPAFDDAGNMTIIPKPKDLTNGYTAKYDAWNRLVELKDETSTVVTTNTYDGLNRRIIRDETGGSGDKIHYYYNENWQVLEERVGSATTADRQYVYHPHYIDALAMSINASGTKHFYTQDDNFNVTAAINSSGSVVERYHYSPYGEVTYLNPNFSKKQRKVLPSETNSYSPAEGWTQKRACN